MCFVRKRFLSTAITLLLLLSCICIATASEIDPLFMRSRTASPLQPLHIVSATDYIPTTMLYGVDVSEWDATVDWDTLKNAVDFVIMRSSYGHESLDKQFARNQVEARRVGILLGYYHYSYPEYNDPESEADHFVDTVGTLLPGEIMCLDYEERAAPVQGIGVVDWCARFNERVYARTGVKPLLYVDRSMHSSYDWSRVISDGNSLWLAAWDGITNFTSNPVQWPSITFKQYSATGTAAGVPVSEVDMDIFNGGASQFRSYGLRALPPDIKITNPTQARTYTTTSGTLSIGGTTADNVGISQVRWSNSRGGSGLCTGTNSWSVNSISLQPGKNIITVTATNSFGTAEYCRLSVYYSKSAQEISLAGVRGGTVWYTSDLSNWQQISDSMSQVCVADLNRDGKHDLLGLSTDGTVWYTTDESMWTQIPGKLSSMVTADFNGDGYEDVAGLAADNTIWYSTDRATWKAIPGRLTSIVAGDFTGSGIYGLAGLASDNSIWYTTNKSTWKQIPGRLVQIVAGDTNGDRVEELIGLSADSRVWYTSDFQSWTNVPGFLKSIAAGDIIGSGKDQITGISADGQIWYTSDLNGWKSIPGRLKSIATADLNADGTADIVGFAADGSLWCNIGLQTWKKMPLTLDKTSAKGR